ncbi:MAG: bacteriohemerythrin [Gammaproteobacteria bacterium]|nr:bacteriohemerythrin [Gammaproteobacteria bacterium]
MSGFDNPVPWVMIVILITIPYIHKKLTDRQFLSWNDDLSVGIEDIDHDHKRLINLINNLQTAVLYPAGESYERQALKDLIDYTVYHFDREEELMQKYDYPDFDAHQQTHKNMIEKVNNYVDRYESDSEEAIGELLKFLKIWLIKHIAGTDQEYSDHIKQKMAAE